MAEQLVALEDALNYIQKTVGSAIHALLEGETATAYLVLSGLEVAIAGELAVIERCKADD